MASLAGEGNQTFMTKTTSWVDYFTHRLVEAQKDLAAFNNAIEQHGLRIRTKVQGGEEKDITEETRRDLERTVEDISRALRND